MAEGQAGIHPSENSCFLPMYALLFAQARQKGRATTNNNNDIGRNPSFALCSTLPLFSRVVKSGHHM